MSGRVALLPALGACLALLGACGDKAPRRSPAPGDAVRVSCTDSFEPTAAMRAAIERQEYVDIGPLTMVRLREMAAQRPFQPTVLKVLVIATPSSSVRVTIARADRSRAGFVSAPATNTSSLPAGAKPEFEIAGCAEGRLSRRSLAYRMLWAVASPGCVHFTVTENGAATTAAAVRFGDTKRC
jgi:hypothetical protein